MRWIVLFAAVIAVCLFIGCPPAPLQVFLCEKDPGDWGGMCKEGGAIATLTYPPSAPTFDWGLSGSAPLENTEYVLIYYPDPWETATDCVSAQCLMCLGFVYSDGTGGVQGLGSIDIGENLPRPCDANMGAKIWLVPISDVDCTNKCMLAWNPGNYLFERNLITYEKSEPLPIP